MIASRIRIGARGMSSTKPTTTMAKIIAPRIKPKTPRMRPMTVEKSISSEIYIIILYFIGRIFQYFNRSRRLLWQVHPIALDSGFRIIGQGWDRFHKDENFVEGSRIQFSFVVV